MEIVVVFKAIRNKIRTQTKIEPQIGFVIIILKYIEKDIQSIHSGHDAEKNDMNVNPTAARNSDQSEP